MITYSMLSQTIFHLHEVNNQKFVISTRSLISYILVYQLIPDLNINVNNPKVEQD